LGSATFEVGFVTVISLLPLVLARIEPFAKGDPEALAKLRIGDIFISGQLALYALSSLATIFLFCLNTDLPKVVRFPFGAAVVVTLIFISFVLGADPLLTHASTTFIGPLTGWIFVGSQFALLALYAMSVAKITDGPTIASEDAKSLTRKLQDKLKKEHGNG
jgi:hypothetical protein